MEEMCRVAGAARVFPLLGDYGKPSLRLDPVIHQLQQLGCSAERRKVPYGFLHGADGMLPVTRPGQ